MHYRGAGLVITHFFLSTLVLDAKMLKVKKGEKTTLIFFFLFTTLGNSFTWNVLVFLTPFLSLDKLNQMPRVKHPRMAHFEKGLKERYINI